MKKNDKKIRRGGQAKKVGAVPAAPAAVELLSMDEAIALLKTTRPTFYRWLREGKIKGMKVGRQWRFTRDDVQRFLQGEGPRIDLPADATPLIEALARELDGHDYQMPGIVQKDDPIIRAVSMMIALGRKLRASDIHTDTFESHSSLRYRIDGVLKEVCRIDSRLMPAIVQRWKIMAGCNAQEKQVAQDGRILVKCEGRDLDLRICLLPSVVGESVTVRILDKTMAFMTLAKMPYADDDRRRLTAAIAAPWGLVMMSGPTGCGKTTTLYACLQEVNRQECKVMSVEDPVEYLIPGVVQVPVRAAAGMTFARITRAFLRSDPDVILIGEIRDAESLAIAQQAALTGHLVLSTLHASDASLALKRMVDIGGAPFIVADATRLVMSQRLVRRLCPKCSTPAAEDTCMLSAARALAEMSAINWADLKKAFRDAKGCPDCAGTGYRGRTVIAETLTVSEAIGRALRDGASANRLREIAVAEGMRTFAADGVCRAAAGETSLREVIGTVGRLYE